MIDTILNSIQSYIESNPDIVEAMWDYFKAVKNKAKETGIKSVISNIEWLRVKVCEALKKADTVENAKSLNELLKLSYLFLARDDFHSYLIYLEWNRAPKERFYQPRMRVLRQIVDAIQKLVDDELDELFLSMPARVGKTSIIMFLVTWLVGRDSEKSNLYSAYSSIITDSFYQGCLEIMRDPFTYTWNEVFPEAVIVSTDGKDTKFNVNRIKRYPSMTARSLYGTLNGACDCSGFLIADDLLSGIEEAMSPDRLASAWSKVDNNLLPRAKEKAKILFMGTRWAVSDPAGVRMDLLTNDKKFANRRFDIINIPALDANGESNFNYDYDVGFTTDYFNQRMASFERNNDMPSWYAQYMGIPVERSGCLFEPGDMKYYNGKLPEALPVRIFMAVDPAFGGGDFTSAPICFQYEDGMIFVHDVVFSSADKRITQPMIVEKIIKYGVTAVQIECSKATMPYKEKIEEMLEQRGVNINVTSKFAPHNTHKENRIFDHAADIRDFFFIESGKRTKEYSQFMQNLFSYKIIGKNKNDDAPDSLCMAVDMILGRHYGKAEVYKRSYF